MGNTLTTEKIVPYALLGMTAVTGLVDAVSFLSLGRVFTANMTGNVVILAFATARVPGLSIAHSLTALLSLGRYSADRSWPVPAPTHRFDSRHKRSCWRRSFSLWRHFAASDT